MQSILVEKVAFQASQFMVNFNFELPTREAYLCPPFWTGGGRQWAARCNPLPSRRRSWM